MRKLLLLAGMLMLAALALAGSGGGAAWIVSCQLDHAAMDDPIVFPGHPGASHMHEFVGAKGVNAFTTAASLRTHGTTCGSSADTSGYWTPDATHYALGTQRHVLVYYRRMASDGITVHPFPLGLKMIVGSAHAMSPMENAAIQGGHIRWRCTTGGGDLHSSPPLCGTGMLITVVDFPNCWNGTQLDSQDHISHLSYDNHCSAVAVPAIREFIRYVGSGAFDVASGPWYTFHADFFDGWDPVRLQQLVSQCMNPQERNCGENP